MSVMGQEIQAVPAIVARQIETQMADYREAGLLIAGLKAPCLVTCARGTSDHAATFFKYLVEIGLGIPVSSIGPSVASVYGADLKLEGIPVIAISQSGASADLVATLEAARAGGARTIVLTNDTGSPLASTADCVLDMAAGPERAVAATKTFIASLVTLAAIYSHWNSDSRLQEALAALPQALDDALAKDWDAALAEFAALDGLYAISRGPAFAIACETALKLKETCRLHAEAFSAAEVRHGPIELAGSGFTALAFATRDRSKHAIEDSVGYMRRAGARVLVAGTQSDHELRTARAGHPWLDPACQILSLYRFAERLSLARGLQPDTPRHLTKVTVTR